MKALSKDQVKEKSELIERLRSKHEDLNEAIGVYNAALATHRVEVEEALEALNEEIRAGKEWAEVISQDQSAYYDDKTEKWQEGEKGQQYSTWKEEYENISGTEDLTVDFPDEIEVPDCELADNLENLPDEP